MDLNKRQSFILEYINKYQLANRIELQKYLETVDDKISKNTILRDLDFLLKNNYIKKRGFC